MIYISEQKFSIWVAVVTILLYPAITSAAITSAQSWDETLEISCSNKNGQNIAEVLVSKAPERTIRFEKTLRCNDVLSNLLASGFELASLSKTNNVTTYILEGSLVRLAIGPQRPDPVPLIRCIGNSPSGTPPSIHHTCICEGDDCAYLAAKCEPGEIENGRPTYTCDDDESTE